MGKQTKAAIDYSALVSEAEVAVRSVKDPELKRVAFEKILEELLAAPKSRSGGSVTAKQETPPAGKQRPPTKKRSGPKAYVEELVSDGFFKKPKTLAQVKSELANRGHHIATTSLSGPLQKLCQDKVLRRSKETINKKKTYCYAEY